MVNIKTGIKMAKIRYRAKQIEQKLSGRLIVLVIYRLEFE
jgi:hypothetical protein